ncbi:MAG: hypothetical protein IPJ87_17990 [Flavobacteriales bacterium]|jgi:hypothetical protein|nr:hypothetical protein [Flavobacteriales bacterium]MBK7943737.1 hypothetical protein [Flavobacteriales bacterium]MBK9699582.1 hypothetical protein [Flavobacteriales bacterium]
MERNAFFKGLIVSTFLLISAVGLHAQTNPASTLTLRVDGLTAQERDALTEDLRSGTGLKLAYACVPAGLLVIAPADPLSGIDPRSAAAASIGRTVTSARAHEETLTQQQVEARCTNARNQ